MSTTHDGAADGSGPVEAPVVPETPAAAAAVFGDRLAAAERYVALLAGPGHEQGVIGPRELPRLWDRHVLNSAAVGEVLPADASVVDVGSGAGLPGIPLALARPDLTITLLEPMARRVAWLERVVEELGLGVTVVRGRAEEREARRRCGESDVVTARAVAPIGRLTTWTLPLVRPGGILAAMKGASAASEVERDLKEILAAGGDDPRVVHCGVGEAATTVVLVSRSERRGPSPGSGRRARGRKDRARDRPTDT
ncbi:16S rRNA (guanine(527)-N(7))-methyltransferase RsmG [Actinomycetospora straminea]|uniref:Ribosomal RNA small subunit methyltransferase G n=1 Tax=Actinomycetospora straminea TaxID=663607 RepID=A0ABP9E7C8_9PSEU|nr:16S rRNA (guanine(527)-N(7))-methyltransferase RsmG [Actinomycetospora straminea]MDD7932811.1 16S rRNA (guanine(527)-N(7))-methyltransferase RsmG [Actinomycetospora straminea]